MVIRRILVPVVAALAAVALATLPAGAGSDEAHVDGWLDAHGHDHSDQVSSAQTRGVVAEDAETAVRDIIFPVVGDVRWTDTFGACRSGCSRQHEGQDLMADKLQPLVAATDGTVTWMRENATPDGSRGNLLIMADDDGWEYWYIHINNDSPGTDDGANPREWAFTEGIEKGARVFAGQHIAFVGDSGNAEWTAPHLHFEIHKPDGSVINPRLSLEQATVLEEPYASPEGGNPDAWALYEGPRMPIGAVRSMPSPPPASAWNVVGERLFGR